MSDEIIKILIAEDDPFLSKIMGNRLREEGYEVDTAHDGEEAFEKIKADRYSLVMLDLIMPLKSGFEVLQALKEREDRTPVLVFTNLAQEEDRQEVLSLGAKGYYVKSDIAMDDLVITVHRYLDNS